MTSPTQPIKDSGTKMGVTKKWVLESLKSLENARTLLAFSSSEGSLESQGILFKAISNEPPRW